MFINERWKLQNDLKAQALKTQAVVGDDKAKDNEQIQGALTALHSLDAKFKTYYQEHWFLGKLVWLFDKVFLRPQLKIADQISSLKAVQNLQNNPNEVMVKAAEMTNAEEDVADDGLPEGVHGRRDWKLRGAEVGDVPPLSNELLEALDEDCPFNNDGTKTRDTHMVLWMTPKLNGKPITVLNLMEMARSDDFGDNKMDGAFSDHSLDDLKSVRVDPVVNGPIDKGYWLLLYKGSPLASDTKFQEQKEYIAQNYPEYSLPRVREMVAGIVMQFGCSGDKRERLLPAERNLCFTRCEEVVDGRPVYVGRVTDGHGSFVVGNSMHAGENDMIGINPVRRFI